MNSSNQLSPNQSTTKNTGVSINDNDCRNTFKHVKVTLLNDEMIVPIAITEHPMIILRQSRKMFQRRNTVERKFQ